MARPDLEQLHPGKELGGWQAVDSTPQEASGPSAFRRSGTMQCGPASVAGVRLGLSLPYDGDFLIGDAVALEVAEERHHHLALVVAFEPRRPFIKPEIVDSSSTVFIAAQRSRGIDRTGVGELER